MTCIRHVPCPSAPKQTLAEVLERGGFIPSPPGYRHHEAQKRIIEPAPSFILCGNLKPDPPCTCGHSADMLCDAPMGRGKTCDLPLCYCCGKHVGDDTDLCRIHFAEFVARLGVERVNEWPPRKP